MVLYAKVHSALECGTAFYLWTGKLSSWIQWATWTVPLPFRKMWFPAKETKSKSPAFHNPIHFGGSIVFFLNFQEFTPGGHSGITRKAPAGSNMRTAAAAASKPPWGDMRWAEWPRMWIWWHQVIISPITGGKQGKFGMIWALNRLNHGIFRWIQHGFSGR